MLRQETVDELKFAQAVLEGEQRLAIQSLSSVQKALSVVLKALLEIAGENP